MLSCEYLLAPPETMSTLLPQLIESRSTLRGIDAPKLDSLLDLEKVPSYVRRISEDQAKVSPFAILHSSGSTGNPKPIELRHGWTTAFHVLTRLAEYGLPQTVSQHGPGTRFMLLFPLFHSAGLGGTIGALMSRNILILPPAVPLQKDLVVDMIRCHSPQEVKCPPSLIVDLAADPKALRLLSQVDSLTYGGGPLPQRAAQTVAKYTHIQANYGSTETGSMPLEWVANEDLPYIKFSPVVGAEFHHHADDLYELVIVRSQTFHEFQAIFSTFPDLDTYHTNDLFSRHPDPKKPDLWLLQGRTDDIIAYSTGEKVNPTQFENVLNGHPLIRSALVYGRGKFHSALLVEPRTPLVKDDEKTFIDAIWAHVRETNKDLPGFARISKDMIFVVKADKPLPRTGKGTVQKPLALKLYQTELDAMYEDSVQPSTSQPDLNSNTISPDQGSMINGPLVTDVEAHLLDFVKDAFDFDELSIYDNIFDRGCDSLGALNLARRARTLVPGVIVQPADIYRMPTIAQLASYFRGEVTTSEQTVNEKLSSLYNEFAARVPICLRPAQEFKRDQMVVLLTGSTGSLGSYLLDTLCKRDDIAKIICLNRTEDGKSKQMASFRARGLDKDSIAARPINASSDTRELGGHPRVKFLQADLSHPHFNFAISEYRSLLAEVTHIYHNAWPVNFNLSLDSFLSHVSGVEHLVDFSSRSRYGAHIFFVSSVGAVLGDSSPGASAIPEEIPQSFAVAPPTGYGQSKLLSERLLDTAAKEAGTSSTICRLGQIAGPTAFGKGSWPRQEWFPSLLISSRTIGSLPLSLGHHDSVDWIPVDDMARSLVDLLLQDAREPAEVVQFVNPRKSEWSQFLPFLEERLKLPAVPLDEWIELVQGHEEGAIEHNPAVKLLDFYRSLLVREGNASKSREFNTANAQARSPTLKSLPAVNVRLLDIWLHQWGL